MVHYHGFVLFHQLGIFRICSTARRRNQARRLARRQLAEPQWRGADDVIARECIFPDDNCVFWRGEDYAI